MGESAIDEYVDYSETDDYCPEATTAVVDGDLGVILCKRKAGHTGQHEHWFDHTFPNGKTRRAILTWGEEHNDG